MKLLVTRFSALGDVAMTIPVVWSLAEQYPELEICVCTRERFVPLFYERPDNVRFIAADFNNHHKGMIGLHSLYYHLLQREEFDYVADLHNVLRTQMLSLRFRLAGAKVVSIRKGRKEKARLVSEGAMHASALPTTIQRYIDVFARLGFPLAQPLPFKTIFNNTGALMRDMPLIAKDKLLSQKWIGIAPYARYKGKTYPIEAMREVAMSLSAIDNIHIFLFGAGTERITLREWQEARPDKIHILCSATDTDLELMVMTQLDLMIAMDSANMHLASLVGLRVLSVWGATHPHAGFLGYGQREEDAIQRNLPCRPCSVFGNKSCKYGTYACFADIQPSDIVKKAIDCI